jgi:hypothetical protein
VKVLIVVSPNVGVSRLFDVVVSLQNVADCSLDHSKSRKTKNIELDETKRFKVSNVLALGPRSLTNVLRRNERHVVVKVLCDNHAACVSRTI